MGLVVSWRGSAIPLFLQVAKSRAAVGADANGKGSRQSSALREGKVGLRSENVPSARHLNLSGTLPQPRVTMESRLYLCIMRM